MKKTLLITLLLIPFLGFSQTKKPIDGFLGIKFGSTKAAVQAAMKAKGAVLNKETSDNNMLVFNNVKLGSHSAEAFLVNLDNNIVYSATFIFRPEHEPEITENYYTLVNEFNSIYGDGKQKKDFISPYREGDGYELTALRTANAKYYTDWKSGENSIQAAIRLDDDALIIVVNYNDGILTAKAEKKESDKNKSDY